MKKAPPWAGRGVVAECQRVRVDSRFPTPDHGISPIRTAEPRFAQRDWRPRAAGVAPPVV